MKIIRLNLILILIFALKAITLYSQISDSVYPRIMPPYNPRDLPPPSRDSINHNGFKYSPIRIIPNYRSKPLYGIKIGFINSEFTKNMNDRKVHPKDGSTSGIFFDIPLTYIYIYEFPIDCWVQSNVLFAQHGWNTLAGFSENNYTGVLYSNYIDCPLLLSFKFGPIEDNTVGLSIGIGASIHLFTNFKYKIDGKTITENISSEMKPTSLFIPWGLFYIRNISKSFQIFLEFRQNWGITYIKKNDNYFKDFFEGLSMGVSYK